MNGIESRAYIADFTAKDCPAARSVDLMPWNWQAPLHFADCGMIDAIARLLVTLSDT